MAKKVEVPNNLGPFLTQRKVRNIDVYAKTGIPPNELSLLRSGEIKKILGRKLYLIAKACGIDIETMLINTYPELKLIDTPTQKLKKTEFESIKDFFEHIQDDVVETIATKTGLTPFRIKNIKHDNVDASAHEFYLIELASGYKPGTLFKIKFNTLQLNSKEEQERLLELERAKGRKKVK